MEPNVTLLEPDSLLWSLMASLISSSDKTPCSDIPTQTLRMIGARFCWQ